MIEIDLDFLRKVLYEARANIKAEMWLRGLTDERRKIDGQEINVAIKEIDDLLEDLPIGGPPDVFCPRCGQCGCIEHVHTSTKGGA